MLKLLVDAGSDRYVKIHGHNLLLMLLHMLQNNWGTYAASDGEFQTGPRSNGSQCLIWSEDVWCYVHSETVGPAIHVDIRHIPFDGNNCPWGLWLLSAVQCGLLQRFGNSLMSTTKSLRGCLWIPQILIQFSVSGMCWTNKSNPCRLCLTK